MAGRLSFGRLSVPGVILLYDQPAPPWVLPSRLSAEEAARLRSAGATVEPLGGAQTVVRWPGETLRDFMLRDVLMHELGHHAIQQYTGKRRARVMRTRDHEASATRLARRSA